MHIDGLTLVIVATQNHRAASAAAAYSQREIKFEKALMFSDIEPSKAAKCEHIKIQPFETVADWGKFIVFDLHQYIETSHILLIHEDGFVVNPSMWNPAWLSYDFIGSPFPMPTDDFSYRDEFGKIQRVGNSVSIRSKKLLGLPSQLALPWRDFQGGFAHEDGFLCVQHRTLLERRGIRFAPFEVALHFGREKTFRENKSIKPFVFHQWSGKNWKYPCFDRKAVLRKTVRSVAREIFK